MHGNMRAVMFADFWVPEVIYGIKIFVTSAPE
jgi:hypothetical protein